MSNHFTITKTEKGTEDGKTITVDIKRADSGNNTIGGSIEKVVVEWKEITGKE